MSFLPPIIYTVWIRNSEIYNKESWRPILLCFLWGASIAVIAAIILELLLQIPLAISITDNNMFALITVIVIAPIAEEFTKPLALHLKTVKKEIDELEDGLIYGAIAGLGFSATENLLYGYSFLPKGLLVFFILMIMRSIGGCLLHASATAWTGFGYGKFLMNHTSIFHILPYFALAMVVHGMFNFLVTLEEIGILFGVITAFILVILTITRVRIKIQILDRV
jgi:RsiW-degrading membrane proteinase PrsW (M82 family)